MAEKSIGSKSEKRRFGNETIEVILCKLKDREDSKGRFPSSIEPGETVVDGIRIERDTAVTMRDGTIIYLNDPAVLKGSERFINTWARGKQFTKTI